MKLNDVCLFVSNLFVIYQGEYITSLECKGKFSDLKNLPIKLILKIHKQFYIQTSTMYNIPGVLLTKLTNAVYF